MSSEAFSAVNVPLSIFSIILNIFFVFCIIFPHQEGEQLKQPLKALLGSLVGCNIAAHIWIIVMIFISNFKTFTLWWCVTSIAVYIMMMNINCSHWLNFFYCFQIIPSKHPYFIWVKRNVRVFIYCALTINITGCLLGMGVNIAFVSLFNDDDNMTDWTTFILSNQAAFSIRLCLFSPSLFLMLTLSCVTVFFLWRHMKNMKKSCGSYSSPRRQRQIRVSIISISVQALLYITCSTLFTVDEIIFIVSSSFFDLKNNMLSTVSTLYCFGTTVNLGLSQSVFRQRAVHVWQKIQSISK